MTFVPCLRRRSSSTQRRRQDAVEAPGLEVHALTVELCLDGLDAIRQAMLLRANPLAEMLIRRCSHREARRPSRAARTSRPRRHRRSTRRTPCAYDRGTRVGRTGRGDQQADVLEHAALVELAAPQVSPILAPGNGVRVEHRTSGVAYDDAFWHGSTLRVRVSATAEATVRRPQEPGVPGGQVSRMLRTRSGCRGRKSAACRRGSRPTGREYGVFESSQ